VLALAVNVLLGRMLGAAEYGHYMTLLSGALILGGLAARGSDQLLTRELAAGAADNAEWRHVLKRWAVKRTAIGVALAGLVYLIWLFISETSRSVGYLSPTALAGVLLITLSVICALAAGALNGFAASMRSQSLVVVKNVVILVSLGIFWWFLGRIHAAWMALWLQVGGYAIAFVVGWYWFHTVAASPLGSNSVVAVAGNLSTKRWSSTAHHFLLVGIAALLVNRLDVVLVSGLAGNETAGIYVAGARLAQLALMVALAVNVVLSPRISSAWAQKDHAAVQRLLRSGLMFTVPVAVIEVAVVALFGRDIVALFGPAYAQSAMPLFWVTLAYALWTVAAPGYALLAMTGSEKVVAGLSWLVVITNVGAILVLVPLDGATGAGLAMTIGYGLSFPALVIAIQKQLLTHAE
ncbi:MAG: oligosaccharide flippase family protein, partial [Ferrovum sp.]|nr:oligosaccharide flippase family protein [Ferrovum sp.]